MNVEIGAEAALFPEKEYINGIAVAVWRTAPEQNILRIGTYHLPPSQPSLFLIGLSFKIGSIKTPNPVLRLDYFFRLSNNFSDNYLHLFPMGEKDIYCIYFCWQWQVQYSLQRDNNNSSMTYIFGYINIKYFGTVGGKQLCKIFFCTRQNNDGTF